MGLLRIVDLKRRQFLPKPSPVRWGRLLAAGLFFGILIGVAIGCLIAPASGRFTRSRVRRRIDEMKDQISESASELESTGQNLIKEAEKQVRTAKQAVSRQLERSDEENKD